MIEHFAFTRIETADDLHDAVLLLLSGVNLTFEPVIGLHGLVRPAAFHRAETDHRIYATTRPDSIAAAVRSLVTDRGFLSVYPIGATTDAVYEVLAAIGTILSYRAARELRRTDIIDIMGWVSTLRPKAGLCAQLPYGGDEWAAHVRSESSMPAASSHPAPVRMDRSLVCYAPPDPGHLRSIFAHLVETGSSITLVNGTAAIEKVATFKGSSGGLLLPNRGFAPMVTTRGWSKRVLEAAGRQVQGLATQDVPKGLQPAWAEQRSAIISVGVRCPNMGREEREAALKGVRKVCSHGQDLTKRRMWPDVAAPFDQPEIVLDAERAPVAADALLQTWRSFVCGRFSG